MTDSKAATIDALRTMLDGIEEIASECIADRRRIFIGIEAIEDSHGPSFVIDKLKNMRKERGIIHDRACAAHVAVEKLLKDYDLFTVAD